MMIRYLLIVLTFVSAAVLTAQTRQEIDVRVGWDKRVNDTLLFRGKRCKNNEKLKEFFQNGKY